MFIYLHINAIADEIRVKMRIKMVLLSAPPRHPAQMKSACTVQLSTQQLGVSCDLYKDEIKTSKIEKL